MEHNKKIYDPIHGFITITPLMQKIIDTPEFQRLRDLKQLGATYYVYPSATHTRFEHSVGVSYLAGIMIHSLQTNQPELDITDRQIELTRIAGLIHDIGHGPFSHLYDHYIIDDGEDEHEERGIKIFKNMVKKYELPIRDIEVSYIIEMIHPNKKNSKQWKFQIIANKQCQIDVDKMDYLQRDCYHLGMKFGGEYSRMLTEVRVCLTPKKTLELAWPEKIQFDIFSLFTTRYRLHKQVYNHHTVKAYEYVVINILKKIYNTKPNFLLMTDSVISCRYHSQYSDLQDKISKREIPKLIKETITPFSKGDKIQLGIHFDKVKKQICDTIKIGFTSGNSINPLQKVLYYKTHHFSTLETSCFCIDHSKDSFLIPNSHQEVITRYYSY